MNATLLSPFRTRRLAMIVGLAGLAGFAAFIFIAFSGGSFVSFSSKQVVRAEFVDGLNVVPKSSEVRVNGVSVGEVSDVSLEEDRVVVTMNIEPDVALHPDAVARLDLKSLLGEKIVNLDPGDKGEPIQPEADGTIALGEQQTVVGADATALSSGGVESVDLYKGLGRDVVFRGLDAASEFTPDLVSDADRMIAQVRGTTENLVKGQAGFLDTLDDIETMTDTLLVASQRIGALVDTKRIIERKVQVATARARVALMRADSAVQIVRGLLDQRPGYVDNLLSRLKLISANGKEMKRLFEAGRMIPSALVGLGPLFDKDHRPEGPGPNPVVTAPPSKLDDRETLNKELGR